MTTVLYKKLKDGKTHSEIGISTRFGRNVYINKVLTIA